VHVGVAGSVESVEVGCVSASVPVTLSLSLSVGDGRSVLSVLEGVSVGSGRSSVRVLVS